MTVLDGMINTSDKLNLTMEELIREAIDCSSISRIDISNILSFNGKTSIPFNKNINVLIGNNVSAKRDVLLAMDIISGALLDKFDKLDKLCHKDFSIISLFPFDTANYGTISVFFEKESQYKRQRYQSELFIKIKNTVNIIERNVLLSPFISECFLRCNVIDMDRNNPKILAQSTTGNKKLIYEHLKQFFYQDNDSSIYVCNNNDASKQLINIFSLVEFEKKQAEIKDLFKDKMRKIAPFISNISFSISNGHNNLVWKDYISNSFYNFQDLPENLRNYANMLAILLKFKYDDNVSTLFLHMPEYGLSETQVSDIFELMNNIVAVTPKKIIMNIDMTNPNTIYRLNSFNEASNSVDYDVIGFIGFSYGMIKQHINKDEKFDEDPCYTDITKCTCSPIQFSNQNMKILKDNLKYDPILTNMITNDSYRRFDS